MEKRYFSPIFLAGMAGFTHAALIVIDPANVTASSQIGDATTFDRDDDYIVDGSGLTGGQHTGSVEPNMWLSSGTTFGGVDTDPRVTFDLGAEYVISQIQVWNYNESPPNLTARGVNAVTINYGTTPALGATVPGITNFAQATGAETYTGEIFNSFAPFTARYIEFDIDSNHGGDNNFYGLSEVQFDGVLVPEPSTALLGGLALLGLIRRRC
ncbi:MAG: PEP-CTERM sorting domain-containing protein [Akkermansiaceae bacterium]